MQIGDCFVNRAAPGLKSHPWIIISNPAVDPHNVLIVNLTDAEKHHDASCELVPADFPEVITKRSYVAYQWANVTSLSQLRAVDSRGDLFRKGSVPPRLLQKVLDGAHDSDELKGGHRELLRCQGLID